MTELPRQLLPIAVDLATQAGDMLREGQTTSRAAVADTKSSPVDVVTQLDRESEHLIVSGIRRLRPDDSILGEEGSQHEGSSQVRWVIDPLDGTVNFTHGLPEFAVCIGVEIDGVASAGVVYKPVTGELFRAASGDGAFLDDRRITLRQPSSLAESLVATGFDYSAEVRSQQAKLLVEILPRVADIRRFGSAALEICDVARGFFDAYYQRGVKRWDVCAAEVIAREAGATVTSFEGGTPTRSAIVAHPSLHGELSQLIGRYEEYR